MLLAYEKGAELIVAVGTHSSMVEFFDKGRAGMASTFLVRMKVGPILVDAKGVSRLYQHRIHKRDLALLVLSTVFTLVVITLNSEPVRLVLRGYWPALTSYPRHTLDQTTLPPRPHHARPPRTRHRT